MKSLAVILILLSVASFVQSQFEQSSQKTLLMQHKSHSNRKAESALTNENTASSNTQDTLEIESFDSDVDLPNSEDSEDSEETSEDDSDDDGNFEGTDLSFGQDSANKIISEIASCACEEADSDNVYFYDLDDLDETFDYSINLADYLENVDKEDSEYFDDSDSQDTDSLLEGALVDLVIAILNKIDVGDDTVNFLIKNLEDLIDGKYEDDYTDAAQAMYAVDEDACDLIYAWLVNYDIDEITFLTLDSMNTLNRLKDGFDNVYEDRKSTQYVVDLEYLDSLQVFLTVLAKGLELLSNSSEYAESVIAKCDSWSQEKYDGNTEDLAEDSYDWDVTRTQYVFAWFLRLDIDDTQILSDDSKNFLNDYFHELIEVYEDEITPNYEQGEDTTNFIQNKESQSFFPANHLTLSQLQKQNNFLQTETKDDYTIAWLQIMIQAVLFLDNADPDANTIIDALESSADQYWDGDLYECAMDCYKVEQNTTNALLLSFSLLDLDEASFLTDSNRDFINDYAMELRIVYVEEEQDQYDRFVQMKAHNHKTKNGKMKNKQFLNSK